MIDDVHGWDFVRKTADPIDRHGHGTHVSGIIISELKKYAMDPENFKIMVVKYYDQSFTFTDTAKNTINALRYAVNMGADIINYSGGGPDPQAEELEILEIAEKKGILLIAAAGNFGTNSDQNKFYPAGYGLKNIISVTALDPAGNILPSSNFGTKTVEFAAEGFKIRSFILGNKLGYMTGTSQATAFVTAAAALIAERTPDMLREPSDIIKTLRAGAMIEEKNINKAKSGRLNVIKSRGLYPSGVSAFGIQDFQQNKNSSKALWIRQ